jgi:hypothetical protein
MSTTAAVDFPLSLTTLAVFVQAAALTTATTTPTTTTTTMPAVRRLARSWLPKPPALALLFYQEASTP